MCAADCWTDYWLVLGKYKLRMAPTRRLHGQKAATMLNSSTLKSSHDAEVQSSGLEGRLLVLPQDGQDNIEERWAAFRDALYSTVFEKLWLATRRNQNWFPIRWDWWRHTGNAVRKTSTVPSRMAPRHKQGLMPLQKLNKRRRRNFSWYSKKTDEIQSYADRHRPVLWLLFSPQYRWDSTADWEEADLKAMSWILLSGRQPPCSNQWQGHCPPTSN